MAAASPIPLTPDEKALIQRILQTRMGVARIYAILAGIGTAFYLLRIWSRSRYSSDSRLIIIAEPFILLGVFLLVWYFGWLPVMRIKKDLAEGMKEVRAGALCKLSRIDNAYGETITWATVGGDCLYTKSDIFSRFQVGDTVSVQILPRSKVAFAVAKAE